MWNVAVQEVNDHVVIAGKYTKPSAEYAPPLAEHFAEHFHRPLQDGFLVEKEEMAISGIESLVANDLLMTWSWRVQASWRWSFPAHINILESGAFVTLLKKLALEGGGKTLAALLDSRVAKGAR